MVLSLFTMFTEQVFAVVTKDLVHANNGDACDILVIPDVVDELGTLQSNFPNNELITSSDSATNIIQQSCALPSGTSRLVSITNTVMPQRSFSDVWYVADTGTTISNWDGGVGPNNNRAFKIDSVGAHQPLVMETGGTQVGVFESGEKWEFILNSYSGSGVASAFGSVGVPSTASGSTGSIIAIPVQKMVGGEMILIDKTAVLLAGAQMTSTWLIPIIVASIGIGIVLARKF